LKSCDQILKAEKIIILEKIGSGQIFSVIKNIEEIRYTVKQVMIVVLLNFVFAMVKTSEHVLFYVKMVALLD